MRLVIEDEAGTRSVVPFTGEELVIGRAAEGSGWRLPDRNVSRRHARFSRAGGGVYVEDLGSLTGTRLNGEKVTGRRRIRPGDLIEIGGYDLVVMAEDLPATGPGAPPPLPTPASTALAPSVTSTGPAPERGGLLRRAALAGVAALAGGLLVGQLLGRLAR